ncbi:MAG: hypothetical protein Aureis2KO_21760 [Aureisphaera sp.]
MKKIITLITIFMFSAFTIAQNDAQLENILARYETLKNSPLSFDHVLNENFTFQEQQLLLAHLLENREVPTANRNSSIPFQFYAQNIRGDADSFGTLPGTPPYDTFNVLNENGLNIFADDFDANDTLYAIDYDTDGDVATLVTIDPLTGNFSVIDTVVGFSTGHSPTGLSYNFNDGIMYLLSTNGNGTQLYSLNLLTGLLTAIGTGTGTNVGIWLEIDNDGNAWMADASNDQFYSVNLTTGSATAVGPLDIDINFAQDVSYDHENNELFMAAYFGGGTGGIYSVNTDTGLASFIGQTDPINVELGGFSVPPPTLGVDDLFAKKISVYPNPVQNELRLESNNGIEITQAKLYNVLGSDMGIPYANGTMDVSVLAQGIYILVVETTQGKSSRKVVKK